ncbi:delta and Notch-like epidermal growth factor-related receptor [Hypomesus transpacificus]|uniref:delta and Notch-like epidermal growth factor-related receptor n=1 Tax=Hypomesus transpacificus TaxID=137520 RepID=UPI001F07523E|nr:delta and Notch-like epidermal growth factor-related receptor [Hypomesus transpacificus]
MSLCRVLASAPWRVAAQRPVALLLLLLSARVGGTPAPAEPTRATPLADPCEGRPCLNGGACSGQPSDPETTNPMTDAVAYTCTCPSSFTGRNCEFFTDPCASSPCLHGNCSRSDEGEAHTCECVEGYEGERCDQPILDLPVSNWEPAMPPAPDQATPATPTTATQPPQPTSIPSTSLATPTLQPWEPKAGQRLLVVPWDKDQVTEGMHCVSPELCELTSGTLTVSLEVPEETAVKVSVNVSGAPVLWRVDEEGFQRSSVLEGTIMWFQKAADGLVVPDQSLPLGHNYFLSMLRLGSDSSEEVTLRLNLTVKASSCVEPGSRFSDPQCSGKGKCITQPPVNTFFCECEDSYSGIFCEEFDACHLRPCRNNATCTDQRQGDEGRNYTCTCPPGFEGESCQMLVDHCLSEPCRNGATCSSSLAGPRCYCPEGYQGSMCEQRVDPCASGPCHNNGTCSPEGPGLGFSCSCAAGFTGPTCAQLVDFCALNPCAHGVCRSVGTSYRCLCVPGYHGLYCEEEYNECLSAPCQNYATCRDLINAYECVCTAQYEGKHCEVYRDPCQRVHCQNGGHCKSAGLNTACVCPPGYLGESCEVDVNECESNPCHHGGTCIDQSYGFTCHCPPGWVGPSCEIHLQWKPTHPEDSLTNMPRHSLYIIIGALCVAFVLMLIILIVGICRISRIEYQGSSRHAYQEFYNCRSIDSEFSNAIASIRHARFGKKSRPAMYDATPITYEDYSPDDKPLVTLIKTKDL